MKDERKSEKREDAGIGDSPCSHIEGAIYANSCNAHSKESYIPSTSRAPISSFYNFTSDSHCADHKHRIGRFRWRSFRIIVIVIRRRRTSRASPSAKSVREATAKLTTYSALRDNVCVRRYDIPEQLWRHRLSKRGVSLSTLGKLDSSQWLSVDSQVLWVSNLFLL